MSLVEYMESRLRSKGNGSIRITIYDDEMMEGKSKKGKNLATEVLEYAKWWFCWGVKEEKEIPKDVPKGYFVVYVGEEWKRYVIEIGVLKHPLFKILLDSAEEMFGFANGSKLYLPCKECVFVRILQCVDSSL